MSGQFYAAEFLRMMDAWHSKREPRDSALDSQIHREYADILERGMKGINWSIPYFSPSSANSCPRELYEKIAGARKDSSDNAPHQGRWTRIGTAWGDVLQRDLRFIEKHWESVFKTAPPFELAYTDEGFPFYEDFAFKQQIIDHKGHRFSILGTCDGIIQHEDGTVMGLEIKSKQTTSAQTSEYSMKEPKADHVKQCVAYSIMYGLDKYLIVYGNLSKKSWVMSDADYAKTPDLRVFEIDITPEMKAELIDWFAEVMQMVADGTPPPLDIAKWTFNNHKTACIKSLTDDEFDVIKKQVNAVMKSSQPQWMKNSYFTAWQDLFTRRQALSDA